MATISCELHKVFAVCEIIVLLNFVQRAHGRGNPGRVAAGRKKGPPKAARRGPRDPRPMVTSSINSNVKHRLKSQLVLSRHLSLGVGLMLLLCAVCPTHPSTASATVATGGLAFAGSAATTARYEGVSVDPGASICSAAA